MNCPSCSSSHLPYLRSPPRLPQASPSGPVVAGPKPSIAAQLRRHRRPSLPLLLTSTVPAFTLLLVAPATKPGCKLARELGLLALLLATELLRHATAAGRRLRGRGREPERGARAMPAPPRPRPAALAAPGEEATPAAAGLPLLDLAELALDCVLEELSPASLAAMACVCAALRDRCSADALWERHLRAK